jgi:23S rRNA (uridine2552-2'-O)-methyltransferase
MSRPKLNDKSARHDPAYLRAKRENYAARAIYKLEEIDRALALVRPGQLIVDLGAAPGAWSQYLRRRLAPQGAAAGQLPGTLIALDLLDLEPIEGVAFVQGDFRDEEVLARLAAALGGRKADLVVSDMAPNLSGVAVSDAARVAHLVELALEFACAHLKPEGALLAKTFHGSGYSQQVELFKRRFRTVRAIKPKASRAKSAETFLVGRGLAGSSGE